MKKLYLAKESRNEEEKRTGYASYKTLVDRYIYDRVLCNKILEDESIYYNVQVGELLEDTEIYQAFIINDLDEYSIESLRELTNDNNDIIISYSDSIECYVLLVDHFGTSWDYVLTNVKLTDDINEI